MFYEFVRLIFNFVYKNFFRLRVIGLENVPDKGAVIIASNHVSNLDPPTLGTALRHRQMGFMAKAELFKNPVFSFIIRKLGAFPVKRGASDRNAIKTTFEKLKSGYVLTIFPEGTRSKDGELGKGGSGVVSIAAKTGAIVIPTAIIGTEKFGSKKLFPQITVVFGKPFHVTGDVSDKKVLQEKADRLMGEIKSLLTMNKKD